jgi:hypothetical protein
MRHVIRNVIGNLVLAMRHVMHHVVRDVIDHVTQSWGLTGTAKRFYLFFIIINSNLVLEPCLSIRC